MKQILLIVDPQNDFCTYKKNESFVKYVREDVVDKKIDELNNQLRRAEKDVGNLSEYLSIKIMLMSGTL